MVNMGLPWKKDLLCDCAAAPSSNTSDQASDQLYQVAVDRNMRQFVNGC